MIRGPVVTDGDTPSTVLQTAYRIDSADYVPWISPPPRLRRKPVGDVTVTSVVTRQATDSRWWRGEVADRGCDPENHAEGRWGWLKEVRGDKKWSRMTEVLESVSLVICHMCSIKAQWRSVQCCGSRAKTQEMSVPPKSVPARCRFPMWLFAQTRSLASPQLNF